jgi:predicted transcriptional regulator
MNSRAAQSQGSDLARLTADILAAYVSTHKLSVVELPGLVEQIHSALMSAARRPKRARAGRYHATHTFVMPDGDLKTQSEPTSCTAPPQTAI